MRLRIPKKSAETSSLDLLVLPLTEEQMKRKKTGPLGAADKGLRGLLMRTARAEGFRARSDQSFVLHTHGRLPAARIGLVGLGPDKDVDTDAVRRFGARALRLAEGSKARHLGVLVPEGPSATASAGHALQAVVEGAQLASYRFHRYLSRGNSEPSVIELQLFGDPTRGRGSRGALQRGEAVAEAVALARDLVNEPASRLTPARLAQRASRLAKQHKLGARVLGPREIARERMRLVEAVAAGSRQGPRIVRLSYRCSGRPRRKIVLIGKGVTFDSGGLDIKGAANMLEMKVDMAGAAAVLATMMVAARTQPRVHLIGYLSCSENMLGGGAYKPGDIIESRAGLSVEIGNTDAEGRLLLADTLSLAGKDRADVIIDVATLTGACMVALGLSTAGLFSDDDDLASLLIGSGHEAGEHLWRMPLTEPLKEQLKSQVADLKNVGTRYGGAITAALFLREFVPKGARWAHLDIAGPARSSSERDHIKKGGTGFGVRTLSRAVERLGA